MYDNVLEVLVDMYAKLYNIILVHKCPRLKKIEVSLGEDFRGWFMWMRRGVGVVLI